MNSTALRILRELEVEKEISYASLTHQIGKKFGDFRDFYAPATLYTSGLIGATLYQDESKSEIDPARFMASYFYATTRGPGKHQCNEFTAMNDEESASRNKVFLTAKGEVYLEELRQKRNERLFVLGIGVFLAVFSALLTRVVG